MPYETMSCATESTNIVKKLPPTYSKAPNIPTDRMEKYFIKMLAKKPPKLSAPANEPIISVTACDSPPQFVMKSLKIKPKHSKPPNAQH